MHGPHDDSFFEYLAGLESEYNDLQRSGYSGEGFHSPGIRLGVGASHNLPPHLARLKALEAAEKRKKGASGAGRRLGGGSTSRITQLTPKQLALRVSVVPSLLNFLFLRNGCGEVPIELTHYSPLFSASAVAFWWIFVGCRAKET